MDFAVPASVTGRAQEEQPVSELEEQVQFAKDEAHVSQQCSQNLHVPHDATLPMCAYAGLHGLHRDLTAEGLACDELCCRS